MVITYKDDGTLVMLHGTADDGRAVCGAPLNDDYDGPADVPGCPKCLALSIEQSAAVMLLVRTSEKVIEGVSDAFGAAVKDMDDANAAYAKVMAKRQTGEGAN